MRTPTDIIGPRNWQDRPGRHHDVQRRRVYTYEPYGLTVEALLDLTALERLGWSVTILGADTPRRLQVLVMEPAA